MHAKVRKWQRQLLDGAVRRWAIPELKSRAEFFVSLFEPYLSDASQLLDLGGGWGFYQNPLARRGHETCVLDVVQPGIQQAPVTLYDGNNIPFADKCFDVTLFATVLHHIGDLEKVVQEARRVTRGYFIVIEDLYRHPMGRFWTILRDRIYNFEYVGHPCQFKSAPEWVSFFKRQQCELIEQKEVYTWLAGMRILNGLFIFKV